MATTTSQVLKGLIWKRAELGMRQDGQNHSAQKQKLGEGEDLVGSDARGQFLEGRFQIEQQQAGDTQRGGDPQMVVTDQRANQKGGQAGHLGGHSGGLGRGDLVPVRQKQESGDDQKADGQRQNLRA